MSSHLHKFNPLRLIAISPFCYMILSTCLCVQAADRGSALAILDPEISTNAIPPSIFSTMQGSSFVRLVSNNQNCTAGNPGCTPISPSYSGSTSGEMGSPTGSPGLTDGNQNPSNLNPGQSAPAPSQYDLSSNFNAPDSGGIGNPNYVAAAATPGGYLDMAAPVTQFRLRYDDALNNKFPDRGEYVYAQCGCFRSAGVPGAKGPPGLNTSVNYQDVRGYFEYALNPSFSVFAEAAVEFLHYNSLTSTTPNDPNTVGLGNTSGMSDMNVGFKYAFIAKPTEYFTFQLRTYIPTGDPGQGLGTGHVSLEPSLLYYKRLTDRWLVQGQLTEWTPVSVSSFASNVIEYGAGFGYILWRGENIVVTPTFESVGWTFLGGQQFNATSGLQSASGDTIVNIKPGVRIGLSDLDAPSGQQRHSLYFGWGHAVTSQQFYSDIYRVEYRILF
jgi:hypothetical protein